MKRKNGFTLIELLAVIVILAIIALIATPIILNVINDSKKSAAKDSAYGYIDAIEKQNVLSNIDNTKYPTISSGEVSALNNQVNVKGTKPTSGTVTINNGKVTAATLCVDGYTITYDGTKVTNTTKGCESNSSPSEPTPTYTAYAVGDAINYNPETNELCTTPTSTTGTKGGCMKWYVIKASSANEETVDVILDHNTTALVAYETSATYKEYAQASIKNQVDTDTTGWTAGLNPRLITADEVTSITGNSGWSSSTASYNDWFCLDSNEPDESTYCAKAQGTSNYAWLFDYTNGCTSYGCNTADSSNYGYWTSSPVSGNSRSAWCVDRNGNLSNYYVDFGSRYGVRPVITISKSALD